MNNRPIASLSPTLLARKGAARPAMRAQVQPLRAFQDNAARQLDDLGWNDMGHETAGHDEPEAPVQHEAEIVALNPGGEPVAARVPEVVLQQDEIVERFARETVSNVAQLSPEASARPRRSALAQGRRAAFTLRLDAERHLKLRLASVTSNRSAQQLVTEALDRLIADLPDVAELAAKVRKRR